MLFVAVVVGSCWSIMESSVSRVIGYVENRLAIEGKSADSDSEHGASFLAK